MTATSANFSYDCSPNQGGLVNQIKTKCYGQQQANIPTDVTGNGKSGWLSQIAKTRAPKWQKSTEI